MAKVASRKLSWLIYISFLFSGIASEALAARPVIALSPISGPKKSGKLAFETAMIEVFSAKAVDFIGPKKLRKTAKKERDEVRSNYVADAAGADFLISTQIRKVRRGFRLTSKLVDLRKGKTIESAKWNYRPRRKDRASSIEENADNATTAISKKFMTKINEIFPKMVGDKATTAAELP